MQFPPLSRTRGSALPSPQDALGAQGHRVQLDAAAPPALPLSPTVLSCSLPPLVTPGQAWDIAPAGPAFPADAFTLRLRAGSGPAAGLCLQVYV